MNRRLLPLLVITAVLPTQVAAQSAARRTHLQNFKDMALSSCIAKAYKGSKAAADDAVASAGGFNEWTRYDAEGATGRIPALIDRYLGRKYNSFQGAAVRLDLMKCLDMYHGPELAMLARKYVRTPAARTAAR